VTVIPLGWGSPHQLDATYPPAQRNHLKTGLLGIAARRDCPFHPAWVAPSRLVSVALILSLCLAVFAGEPLAPTLSYAVRTFLQCVVSHTTLSRRPCARRFRVVRLDCTSDGLTGFTLWILLGDGITVYLIALCACSMPGRGLFGLYFFVYQGFLMT
jgi:hypothetical protein